MTDVHGEPQQGGALPAQIWHDYMSAVTEGHGCAPLHESTAGLTFQPFYGKYATTGKQEAQASEETPKHHHSHGHPKKSERAVIEVQESPAPKAPAATPSPGKHEPPAQPPPAAEPQTGGAAP